MKPSASLPSFFEGTTQQDGIEEHAYLGMRIDRVRKNPGKKNVRLIHGVLRHLGPPSFGKGLMMTETDFVGEWDQASGEFSVIEILPAPSGPTREKTFHGRLSPDGSLLTAERNDGAEHMNLFAIN